MQFWRMRFSACQNSDIPLVFFSIVSGQMKMVKLCGESNLASFFVWTALRSSCLTLQVIFDGQRKCLLTRSVYHGKSISFYLFMPCSVKCLFNTDMFLCFNYIQDVPEVSSDFVKETVGTQMIIKFFPGFM